MTVKNNKVTELKGVIKPPVKHVPNLLVVSRRHAHYDKACPYCGSQTDIMSIDVMEATDGIHTPEGENTNREMFLWCPCGHKWVL